MSGKHQRGFEAYIHTESGLLEMDPSYNVNCFIINAFRKEMMNRNEIIPESPVYDITPFVHCSGLWLNIRQSWLDGDDMQAIEAGFVFLEGENDGIPTLVPTDKFQVGERNGGYFQPDVKPSDVLGLRQIAAARTGAHN